MILLISQCVLEFQGQEHCITLIVNCIVYIVTDCKPNRISIIVLINCDNWWSSGPVQRDA